MITRKKEIELDDLYKFANSCGHTFLDRAVGKEMSCKIVNELIEYKKIEEELGIDLITYFKLINAKNVYSYGHTNIMKNTGQVDIYDRTITIWNGSCHQTYPLSEYGKSFALTKEELV